MLEDYIDMVASVVPGLIQIDHSERYEEKLELDSVCIREPSYL